jgi:MFS family permease
METPRSLRLRYYAYRVTTTFGFYIPVSVVYLLDKGFGVGFVAVAQATFSFALLAAEVPSGYLGDRLGRRATLALGVTCRMVGVAGYVVAESAAAFLALKVLFGLGWAFRSGTADAWLYDLLAARGDTDEFAHVQSRGSSALLVASAATAVAGGLLYGVDHRLPFAASALLAAAGLPALLAIPAVDPRGEDEDALGVRAALATLRTQLRRPAVRWVVVYTVLLFTVFDLSRTFEQPALDAVGVPVAAMGVLYAALKLGSAGAAAAVGWLHDRLGTRGVLLGLAPVIAVAYGGLFLVPLFVVPVMFVYRSARTVLRPVRNQYLNDRLADAGRATTLSGVSMVLSVVGGVARLVAGEVASAVGPVATLGLVGVGLPAAAGVVWLATQPVRPVGDGETAGAAAGAD